MLLRLMRFLFIFRSIVVVNGIDMYANRRNENMGRIEPSLARHLLKLWRM